MHYPIELSAGVLLDRRYRIQKTLGQGGFGRTYLVADRRRFDELCVLKEFLPKGTDEYVVSKSRELFQREAEVLYQLQHPQIPGFLAHFEEDERLFLVQDYIEGKTYRDLLLERQRQGKTFSETEVIQWLKDLLPVLDYIHSRKIIHRDISPDNIMLPDRGDRPILIDFGVVNHQTLSNFSASSIGSSQPGTTVGKIGYSPVEQIQQGKCYPSSDLYALAVTTVVLLSGKEPEQLFDSEQMQWQWQNYTQVRDELAAILDKMLESIPFKRYQSAQEVLTDLSAISAPDTPRSPASTFMSANPSEDTLRSPASTFMTPSHTNPISVQSGVKTVVSNSQLPKASVDRDRASIKNLTKSRTLKRNLVLAALGILLFGGVLIGMRSPDIAFICGVLDNCSKNAQSETTGDRTVESETKTSSPSNQENTDIFDNPNASPTPTKEALW
jgi:serine/threonine-protein kinase